MLICLPSWPGTYRFTQTAHRSAFNIARAICMMDHQTDRSHRPDVGVEVHVLSQGDDRARVPGDLVRGGGDGSEHGTIAFLLEDAI